MFGIPFLDLVTSKKVEPLKTTKANDLIDRLHHNHTVTLLAMCILVIGSKMQFGEPISCMLDAHLNAVASWKAYFHQYCFISTKYIAPKGMTLSNHAEKARMRQEQGLDVLYYQWVPFFLFLQMFCFILPHLLWKAGQSNLLLDVPAIVKEATVIKACFAMENRQKKTIALADYASNHFRFRCGEKTKTLWQRLTHKKSAAIMYIALKIANMLVAMSQIFLVKVFLGIGGIDHLLTFVDNAARAAPDDFDGGIFPRTIMCDVENVRQMGVVQNHTFQCILPINYVNEKAFLLLGIWFFILTLLSTYSFVSWTNALLFRGRHSCMLHKLLESSTYIAPEHHGLLKQFFYEHLGMDGYLMFHFIKLKAGGLVASAILVQTWEMYCEMNGVELPQHPNTRKTSVEDYGSGDAGAPQSIYKPLMAYVEDQ